MQKYFGIAQDIYGNAIPSATINVYRAGTLTAATLYSDNAYVSKANPFTADADGTYEFYAQNGRYDVVPSKSGFTFNAGNSSDAVLFDTSTTLTPPQILSDQNDYAPTNGLNAPLWRLSTDAARSLTGITAGYAGQFITIVNVGAFPLLLSDESASSAANNRIVCPQSVTWIVQPEASVSLYYDATLTRWVVLGRNRSSILSTSTTVVSISNSSALTTLFTYTLPIQGVTQQGGLRVHAYGVFSNTSGAPVNYTFSTTDNSVAQTLATIAVPTATTGSWAVKIEQYQIDAASMVRAMHVNMNGAAPATFGPSANVHSTRATGFSITRDIVLRCQLGTASANATLDFERAAVELIP